MGSIKLPSLRLDDEGWFHIDNPYEKNDLFKNNEVEIFRGKEDNQRKSDELNIHSKIACVAVGNELQRGEFTKGVMKIEKKSMWKYVKELLQKTNDDKFELANRIKVDWDIIVRIDRNNLTNLIGISSMHFHLVHTKARSLRGMSSIDFMSKSISSPLPIDLHSFKDENVNNEDNSDEESVAAKVSNSIDIPKKTLKKWLGKISFSKPDKVGENNETEKSNKTFKETGIRNKFQMFRNSLLSSGERIKTQIKQVAITPEISIRRLRNVRSRKRTEMCNLQQSMQESKDKVAKGDETFSKSMARLYEFKEETYDVLLQQQSLFKDRIKREEAAIFATNEKLQRISKIKIFKRRSLSRQLKFHEEILFGLKNVVDNF